MRLRPALNRLRHKPAPIPPGMDMAIILELTPTTPGDYVGEVSRDWTR